MAPLPKLPRSTKPKLPPGLTYADHNYQMTSAQYLRWLNKKNKGRR